MNNSLKIFGAVFNNVEGIKAKDENNNEYIYTIGDPLSEALDKTITEFDYDGTGAIPVALFKDCVSLTKINAPNVTMLNGEAFRGCTNVSEYNLDSVTTFVSGGARHLDSFGRGTLSVIKLPNLDTASVSYGMSTIGTSSKPVTIVLPSISSMGSDFFRSSWIAALDLGGALSSMPARTLYQGGGCDILILRKTGGIVTLAATSSVGIGSVAGLTDSSIVYVPQALISAYEADTNWSTAKATSGHNFTFAAIEGSQYETAYADGTPIT